ncbi:MAG: hypothetical protein EAX81_01685 [Candidatus Thorarchaeota archaeon]|nr:hypothetical protein [Candidatus Thorarchaeota archaeon]
MLKPFLVFMCPKCKNFTNAPVGQKRRRCSYCGKIIDITKAATAIFDSPEKASAAVKQFNASRGGDAFDQAVRKTREKMKELIPLTKLRASDVKSNLRQDLPSGKARRLMRLLENEATEKACTLDRIELLCAEYQLDWAWVEHQLTKLANRGVIVFPRPWSIRLVQIASASSKSDLKIDASKEIIVLLKKAGGEMLFDEIVKHFALADVGIDSVEESLDHLMSRGEIYEPKSGMISLI